MIAEPMDVMDLGPDGDLRRPGRRRLRGLAAGHLRRRGPRQRAGRVAWNELNTRDPAAAKEFYGAVFGWTFDDQEMEGAGTYTTIKRRRRSRSAACSTWTTRGVPDEVPAHWHVYFAVEDTDAAVGEGQGAAAATSWSSRSTSRPGRFAILTDPHGAVFAVIALSDEALENA